MRWVWLCLAVACGGSEAPPADDSGSPGTPPTTGPVTVDGVEVELTSWTCCGEIGGPLICAAYDDTATVALQIQAPDLQYGEVVLRPPLSDAIVELQEGQSVGPGNTCTDYYYAVVEREYELTAGSVRITATDAGGTPEVTLSVEGAAFATPGATATIPSLVWTDLLLSGLP